MCFASGEQACLSDRSALVPVAQQAADCISRGSASLTCRGTWLSLAVAGELCASPEHAGGCLQAATRKQEAQGRSECKTACLDNCILGCCSAVEGGHFTFFCEQEPELKASSAPGFSAAGHPSGPQVLPVQWLSKVVKVVFSPALLL